MTTLLRVKLDVLNLHIGMRNAAFEQRRVTVVGTKS